jgi:hypothetical protein
MRCPTFVVFGRCLVVAASVRMAGAQAVTPSAAIGAVAITVKWTLPHGKISIRRGHRLTAGDTTARCLFDATLTTGAAPSSRTVRGSRRWCFCGGTVNRHSDAGNGQSHICRPVVVATVTLLVHRRIRICQSSA